MILNINIDLNYIHLRVTFI